MQHTSLFLLHPVMSCVHVCSQPYVMLTSPKVHRRSWRKFEPTPAPIVSTGTSSMAPLDKTPQETQSVTFLIRVEPWKQRAGSKLCNPSHPLRGKSRVGLSCQREQAMTALCMGGGAHALWMVLSTPQLEELSGGDGGRWDTASLLAARG